MKYNIPKGYEKVGMSVGFFMNQKDKTYHTILCYENAYIFSSSFIPNAFLEGEQIKIYL